jgi:ubiquinone/menaquinone biosynthesis C-methylase UbiE
MPPGPVGINENGAEQYDHFCQLMEWHGHEALFDMMREYVRPEQSVLDLGTGTGLMAALFHAAGLKVYGVDNSGEMLKVCGKKSVVEELKIYDLNMPDWPYGRETFDHVAACGLFHFIVDLDVAFTEVGRLLKAGGTFGFTVKGVIDGREKYVDTGYGITIYCHPEPCVEKLMTRHGFATLKRMIYWTYNDLDKKEKSFFILLVAKKIDR